MEVLGAPTSFFGEAAFTAPHHSTTTTRRQSTFLPLSVSIRHLAQNAVHDEETQVDQKDIFPSCDGGCLGPSATTSSSSSRRSLLLHTATAGSTLFFSTACSPVAPAHAFEGGIGGLGKTKPETGVIFLSDVTQDPATGLVTAEVLLQQQPYLVQFNSPFWPLLPTARGLEVRDLRQPESAFVQIIDQVPLPLTKSVVKNVILTDNILSSRGKFGAYGSPTDLKVTQQQQPDGSSSSPNRFMATFTTLTPGLRESDRRMLLQCVPVGKSGTVLVLVAGTTLQRFGKQEDKLRALVDSLQVTPTPATQLK